VVHHTVLARAGSRLGKQSSRIAAIRAGLYACGWDLATGPAGVLASLFGGELAEARKRVRGNQTLFREASAEWLRNVHDIEGKEADKARRSTTPWMAALLLATVALVGWAIVSSLR
jgi:hypothetical protein